MRRRRAVRVAESSPGSHLAIDSRFGDDLVAPTGPAFGSITSFLSLMNSLDRSVLRVGSHGTFRRRETTDHSTAVSQGDEGSHGYGWDAECFRRGGPAAVGASLEPARDGAAHGSRAVGDEVTRNEIAYVPHRENPYRIGEEGTDGLRAGLASHEGRTS